MTIQEHLEEISENDKYAEKIGRKLADLLYLQKKDGFFQTNIGQKSYIGLARTLLNVVIDDYVNANEIHPS